MNYRSCMKLICIKSGKRSKYGLNFRGCTGTCTGCTGTGHHRPTCTGTGPGCTGTCEPKMPRILCFCVIKPEFVHR